MSYTDLELVPVETMPTAGDPVGTWNARPNPRPTSDAEYGRVFVIPGFGRQFSDRVTHAMWTSDKGQHNSRIEAYGPPPLDPAGAVLHYDQKTFEGLKVYRHKDGSIWTFRPTYNTAYPNHPNRQLAIPGLEHEAFIGSLVNLTRQNVAWVPNTPGSPLYLRPFIFASKVLLGVRAAERYEYSTIASSPGTYFTSGFQPIDVWVEREFHCTGSGGMGDVKTGGNHASSLLSETIVYGGGYDEVMSLDAAADTNIDKLSGMNVFVVTSDGSVRTPKLTDNILAGCTHSSILQLLCGNGADVHGGTLVLTDMLTRVGSGAVAEISACGVAAVITSTGSLSGKDFRVEIPRSKVARMIYDRTTEIQPEEVEDHYDQLYRLAQLSGRAWRRPYFKVRHRSLFESRCRPPSRGRRHRRPPLPVRPARVAPFFGHSELGA